MHKSLDDIKRILEKQKPDTVLNKFIQSYLEGLYFTPLTEIKAEYEILIVKEYPEPEPIVYPQIYDEEIEDYIDDPNWEPQPTEQEIDTLRVSELESEYPWLKEQVILEGDKTEYDLLLQKIADFVPERDEDGMVIENQSALTEPEETRKTELETLYPWLPGEWSRNIPSPSIDVENWRKENYVMLRRPFLQAIDQDSLFEAMHDARQGDDRKLIAHDAKIQSIKDRFLKPITE